MGNHSILLVCFDLGGVVVRTCGSWDDACSRAGLRAHEPADRESFEESVRTLDDRHQLGIVTDEEFFVAIAGLNGGLYQPEEIARIHDAWLLGEYSGMDRLVAELNEAGLVTACLSNTNDRHWRTMCGNGERSSDPRFPAFRMLAVRHASHILGLAKPHPDIYRAFERETARSAREILFFDDRPENVEAARALGWSAERIDPAGDTAGQARAHLRRYGICELREQRWSTSCPNDLRTACRLGCLAAALVLRREDEARDLLHDLKGSGCPREAVREAILQTYLFDGYPSALEGMELLAAAWPGDPAPSEDGGFSAWTSWQARGRDLYNRIYGEVADRLEQKASRLSPELAHWMIVEGYGKVLARPGLDILTREMVIVAVLAVKERPRQLHSHMRGALRVGAAKEMLERLLEELGVRIDPPGLQSARTLLQRLLA